MARRATRPDQREEEDAKVTTMTTKSPKSPPKSPNSRLEETIVVREERGVDIEEEEEMGPKGKKPVQQKKAPIAFTSLEPRSRTRTLGGPEEAPNLEELARVAAGDNPPPPEIPVSAPKKNTMPLRDKAKQPHPKSRLYIGEQEPPGGSSKSGDVGRRPSEHPRRSSPLVNQLELNLVSPRTFVIESLNDIEQEIHILRSHIDHMHVEKKESPRVC